MDGIVTLGGKVLVRIILGGSIVVGVALSVSDVLGGNVAVSVALGISIAVRMCGKVGGIVGISGKVVVGCQLIRYARCCSNFSGFSSCHRALVTRLLSQSYKVNCLSNTIKKFYGRHTDLVEHYKKNICQMFADSISWNDFHFLWIYRWPN